VPDTDDDHLITGATLDELTSSSKTERYRLIKRGLLPKPIKLSRTCARWSYREVMEAIERMKASRNAQ
jgi:predicted DNA-binding transcriptional regulator AlpA